MVTYKEVRENEDIKTYIRMADETLANMRFTEHSFAHVVRCADVAGSILEKLGYDERTVELAQIAAYTLIAPNGHLLTHLPQEIHFS